MVVASEGRAIPWNVLQMAFTLARPDGQGEGGLDCSRARHQPRVSQPRPVPSKREWDEQRLIVRQTVLALKKAGFEASGHVIGTRRATKRILGEAAWFKADAIVMGCDHDRGLLGDFSWAHEPYRVARKARVPVYLVPVEPAKS